MERSRRLLKKRSELVAHDGRRKIKDNPSVIYHMGEFTRDFEKQRLKFVEEYKKSLQPDRRHLYERLARAHAKSGDAAMIAGYLGSSDQYDDALAKYSEAYADQAETDYETFQKAVRYGRLSTEPAKDAGLEFLL